MKKNLVLAFFLFYAIILCTCVGKTTPLVIIPEVKNETEIDYSIGIEDIIETKDGAKNTALPEWLLAFNNGGIDAVEKMEQYSGKYCFIEINKGVNFEALTKWEENFSETRAFTRMAAARIENRLTSKAVLYPDDEYGAFYEKLIKKSYNKEYPDAVTEDTYWIKKQVTSETNSLQDIYEFFVFIIMDKTIMQDDIRNMITQVRAIVTPTRAQNNAINNIQLHFFEGF